MFLVKAKNSKMIRLELMLTSANWLVVFIKGSLCWTILKMGARQAGRSGFYSCSWIWWDWFHEVIFWVILLRCRKWKWIRKQRFSVQSTQLRLVPCQQWLPRASVPTARDPSQPPRRGRCTSSRSPERKLQTASAKKMNFVQFFVAQVHVYVFQCGGCGTKFASKRNLAKHSHKCSSKSGSAKCTIHLFQKHEILYF